MSIVSPAECESRFATGLTEDALQSVIDQQESWLSRQIGALVGERTVTLYPRPYDGPIYLQRLPDPDTIIVTVQGSQLDSGQFRVEGSRIDRIFPGLSSVIDAEADDVLVAQPYIGRWSGIVTVKFTPVDEDDIRAAVISLVRLAVTDSPYSAESGEGHSYTRMASYVRQRGQIARTLQPSRSRGPLSVPMR